MKNLFTRLFKKKEKKKEPQVREYQREFYLKTNSLLEVKDWGYEFSKLFMQAKKDNVVLKYKFVKEFDKDIQRWERDGKFYRVPKLTVLFTDDPHEALSDSSVEIINELLKEIETLGGTAGLLVHENEVIRKLVQEKSKTA